MWVTPKNGVANFLPFEANMSNTTKGSRNYICYRYFSHENPREYKEKRNQQKRKSRKTMKTVADV